MTKGCRHRSAAHRVQVASPGRVFDPDAVAADHYRIPTIELQVKDVGGSDVNIRFRHHQPPHRSTGSSQMTWKRSVWHLISEGFKTAGVGRSFDMATGT